jgi:hypothetical protein
VNVAVTPPAYLYDDVSRGTWASPDIGRRNKAVGFDTKRKAPETEAYTNNKKS